MLYQTRLSVAHQDLSPSIIASSLSKDQTATIYASSCTFSATLRLTYLMDSIPDSGLGSPGRLVTKSPKRSLPLEWTQPIIHHVTELTRIIELASSCPVSRVSLLKKDKRQERTDTSKPTPQLALIP